MALDDCTLCLLKADPRWQLMTESGEVYPLCDGCAPWRDEQKAVADRCRASGKPSMESYRRFGVNEPRERARG